MLVFKSIETKFQIWKNIFNDTFKEFFKNLYAFLVKSGLVWFESGNDLSKKPSTHTNLS